MKRLPSHDASVMTLAEVLAAIPSVEESLANERGWLFDRANLTLNSQDDGYEIDLEELTTSAQILDVIFQVASKTWADDAVLASFVRCLDLLLDPQRFVCTFGKERGPVRPKTVIERQLRQHEVWRGRPC